MIELTPWYLEPSHCTLNNSSFLKTHIKQCESYLWVGSGDCWIKAGADIDSIERQPLGKVGISNRRTCSAGTSAIGNPDAAVFVWIGIVFFWVRP